MAATVDRVFSQSDQFAAVSSDPDTTDCQRYRGGGVDADEFNVTQIPTVFAVALVAVSQQAEPSTEISRADSQSFFAALGIEARATPQTDVWKVAEQPAPFAWMNATGPLPTGSDSLIPTKGDSFQLLLDRMIPINEPDRSPGALHGLINDPGRWKFQREQVGDLFTRKSKFDAPDPNEVLTPYAGRNWKAQEKVQIPVPITLPVAEQLFVYGQLDGSGDALNNHQANLYGKTGVGLKWLLPAKSELQLRYATLLSHSDDVTAGRYQERAQPAVELMARMPIYGPLAVEYTGSAIPAVTRSDTDLFKQELRFAIPLTGDNELEFGARYKWEYVPITPWTDRAEIFLGVKFRR
jgi:hypothetical protein